MRFLQRNVMLIRYINTGFEILLPLSVTTKSIQFVDVVVYLNPNDCSILLIPVHTYVYVRPQTIITITSYLS